MIPSSRFALGVGSIVGALFGGYLVWAGTVSPILGGCAVLALSLATSATLWAVPRFEWVDQTETNADATSFVIIGIASVFPALGITPAMLLDSLGLSTRITVAVLTVSFLFLGYGGGISMLVISHRRYGGRLQFVSRDDS